MKRGWIFLLLLSLGLNLGFAIKIFTADRGGVDRSWSPRGPGGMRVLPHATPDSSAWTARVGQRFERISRDLQLTPEQSASFRKIQADAATDLIQQRRRMHLARRNVHELCLADDLQPALIRQGVRELAQAQGRLDSLVIETMLSELANLTPAQKDRYLRMMPWDRAAHGGRGRRGLPGGPAPRGNPPD